MDIVTIRNLEKRYPSFCLNKVSFSLKAGEITGFVGRNGAGKTTTIKAMLDLVHPDGGEVLFFGQTMRGQAGRIKQRIGYSTGSIHWYPRKSIAELAAVTKHFYPNWDENAYRRYLALFELQEEKSPAELSEGMKIKANLLLALSHRAELLILDEPTSGLDPFSRQELLNLFGAIKQEGVGIFFSTHILSDLEACADRIVYLSQGSIRADQNKEAFLRSFALPGETLEQAVIRMEGGSCCG